MHCTLVAHPRPVRGARRFHAKRQLAILANAGSFCSKWRSATPTFHGLLLASHRCGVATANPTVENGLIVSGFCSFQRRKPSGLILRHRSISIILANISLDDHGPNVAFCVDSTPSRTQIFSVPPVLVVCRTLHDVFHVHVCAWLEGQAQDLPRTCCVNLCT